MRLWEYRHQYIAACHVIEPDESGPQTVLVVGGYPQDRIENYLNSMGGEGWSLVTMEAQWYWERLYYHFPRVISRPRAILGYWCTFKRAKE